MRKTIAARMHDSLQTMAQLSMDMDVHMDECVKLREQLIAEWQGEGIRPSYNDLIIRAAGKALRAHPLMNSQLGDGEMLMLKDVHIGMAVALDSGLVVPVVRNADQLSVKSLAVETARLAVAARDGGLSMDDFAGGTFTVTALGMFGVDSFTPIVNAGSLTASDSFVLTVITGPVPVQPPTGLLVVASVGNVVTLRWAPPLSGPAPTGYVLEGGIAPGQVLGSLPLGTTSPILTLNLPTGSFFLRVHALSSAARSAASNEVLVHVSVPVAPSPPANLLGLVVGNTLNLTWTTTFGGGAPTNVILDVTGAAVGSAPVARSRPSAWPACRPARIRSRRGRPTRPAVVPRRIR